MDNSIDFIIGFSFILFLATFIYSLVIIVFGKKLFKKANKKENTAYYPLVNLFTILEIGDTNVFIGILFFIPILNIVALFISFYNLGKSFRCTTYFNIGLSLLPYVFIPILSSNDKQYKLNDEEYFKALDNVKDKNINLMTQDEILKFQSEVPQPEEQVDSIFKSEFELKEKPETYKAKKIDFLKTEETNNYSDNYNNNYDNIDKPDIIDEFNNSTQSNNNISNQTTKKDDEIEFLEL